jgi:hypothetical protein
LYPNLCKLYCSFNKIITIPQLNNLKEICISNNPIYKIVYNDLNQLKILNRFRYTYYCLRYKYKFMNLLWDKVRRPKIEKMYHPDCLVKFIESHEDWNERIDEW